MTDAHFRILILPKKRLAGKLLLSSIAGFFVVAAFLSHGVHELWLRRLVLLAFSVLSFPFAGYFFRLWSGQSVGLKMTPLGVEDRLSYFRLGQIPIADVERIRLTRRFGLGLCLELQLSSQAKAFRRLKGLRRTFWRQTLLFSKTSLVFPVFLMDKSLELLESELTSYAQSLQGDATTTTEIMPLAPIKENPPMVLTPPAVLKPEFNEMGWAKRLCDFYFDSVMAFPDWQNRQDPRLVGITAIRTVAQGPSLEDIEFKYHEDHFRFTLQKGLGQGADENEDMEAQGLLSIAYAGETVYQLRVQIEIGTLEPLKVEVHARGAWEQRLENLWADMAKHSRKRKGA